MSNLQEIWLPIPNYEGLYEISNLGTVRSLTRIVNTGKSAKRTIYGQTLVPNLNKGYHYIILCKFSKHQTFKIHRLVAQLFIDNPENKPEVNHIDGNRLNNAVNNLEWVTRSENMKHCWKTGLMPMTEKMKERSRKNGLNTPREALYKKVQSLKTGEVFESVGHAALKLGVSRKIVSMQLNGKRENTFNLISLGRYNSA